MSNTRIQRQRRRSHRCALAIISAAALASCSSSDDSDPVHVTVVGDATGLLEPLRLAGQPVADVVLGATAQGLVSFNAEGDVVPALAERWIVEEDGQSYIFRLRQATWTDGTIVRAQDVVPLLQARVRSMRTIMGALQPQIRAMTDLVIEIRLPTPQPTFLQLLAHPALAVARPQGGTGPYRKTRTEGGVVLSPVTDPMMTDGEEDAATPDPVETRVINAARPAMAFTLFKARNTDLVLGARFTELPLLQVADIRPALVRADPVNGLFGLAISRSSAVLDNAQIREAVSMAIDRNRIAAMFNIANWTPRDTILPAQLDLFRAVTVPRWRETDREARIAYAAGIVARQTPSGARATVRIALPAGHGSRLLFRSIANDLAAIGLSAVRVARNDQADVWLIDEVAPHDSATWYLARLSCKYGISCDPVADARLADALDDDNREMMNSQISEAEALTSAHYGFIPIGAPIRWSLVAPRLTGFRSSSSGHHPLNALIAPPN